MYKKTSKNMQGRVSRILAREVVKDITITTAEELDALRKHVTLLKHENSIFPKNHPKKKEIGKRLNDAMRKIQALKGGKIVYPKIRSELMCEVMKEIVPRYMYEMIVAEALKRHEKLTGEMA